MSDRPGIPRDPLEGRLAALRTRLDTGLAAAGAPERVAAALARRVPGRPGRARWIAAAAAMIVAAGLGGAADVALGDRAPAEVIVLDPLLIEPTEIAF